MSGKTGGVTDNRLTSKDRARQLATRGEREGGGEGQHFDIPAQLAKAKAYQPFTASLAQVAGQRKLRLTCPVERGRTYRISASNTLDGQWQKLADFTANEDGQMEQLLEETAGRLFLRVEALD